MTAHTAHMVQAAPVSRHGCKGTSSKSATAAAAGQLQHSNSCHTCNRQQHKRHNSSEMPLQARVRSQSG
jgi:hypothetical protein